MAYLFTHDDKAERERLAAIEAGLDPFTIEHLERIGVREGWRCCSKPALCCSSGTRACGSNGWWESLA